MTDIPAGTSLAASETPISAGTLDAAGTPAATDLHTAPAALDSSDLSAATMDGGLVQMLLNSGYVGWILVALSVLAFTLILLKLWHFAALRLHSRQSADDALALWKRGQKDAAVAKLQNARNPVSQVLGVAMSGALTTKADLNLLREEVARVAGAQLESMRSFLRPLEVIGALSPLLGLLGTVLGMIQAFQAMEAAGRQVDPSVLSGGIWQALLTTALGLVVAIPAVVAHNWLERKVERVRHAMEDSVTQVFTSPLFTQSTPILKAHGQPHAA